MENLITDELIENAFLYCWNKLSNKDDAEDVAQEIVVDAMLILRSGKPIQNFYGLYWRIAHNKVVDFYRKKRPNNVSYDEVENSLLSFDKSVNDYIKHEEIDSLSKSMTKLAQIHRDILVRFYIKNQSVKEIAAALNIPTGTVTGRLSDARKKLKESFMNIENQKGDEAKNTEITDLNLRYFYMYQNAYKSISSLLDRQILFECREAEGKTVGQLAEKLNTSPLFIEDSIQKLCKGEVMYEKGKGRYVTDFAILKQSDIRNARKIATETSEGMHWVDRFMEILNTFKEEMLQDDFYGRNFQWEYLLPYFMIRINRHYYQEICRIHLVNKYGLEYAKDARHKEYDFGILGSYEDEPEVDHPEQKVIVKTYYPFKSETSLRHGKYEVHNTLENVNATSENGTHIELTPDRIDWINPYNADVYFDLIENPEKTLNEKEAVIVSDLLSKGVLVKDGDKYIGSIPVVSSAVLEKWCNSWKERFRDFGEEYFEALFQSQKDGIYTKIRPEFKHSAFWNYFPFGYSFDNSLITYGLTNKLIKFEEGTNQSCVGLVIIKQYPELDNYGK